MCSPSSVGSHAHNPDEALSRTKQFCGALWLPKLTVLIRRFPIALTMYINRKSSFRCPIHGFRLRVAFEQKMFCFFFVYRMVRVWRPAGRTDDLNDINFFRHFYL
jgi:hypothetical protein